MNKDLVQVLMNVALGIIIGIAISYIWMPKKVLFIGTDADVIM